MCSEAWRLNAVSTHRPTESRAQRFAPPLQRILFPCFVFDAYFRILFIQSVFCAASVLPSLSSVFGTRTGLGLATKGEACGLGLAATTPMASSDCRWIPSAAPVRVSTVVISAASLGCQRRNTPAAVSKSDGSSFHRAARNTNAAACQRPSPDAAVATASFSSQLVAIFASVPRV